ncbi:MAG: 3-keto-disaccharide hydrolase [Thermoguttaceae bacterium]
MKFSVRAFVVALLVSVSVSVAAEPRSLFNGENLAGWNICATDVNPKDVIFWTTAGEVTLDPNDPTQLAPAAGGKREDGAIVNLRPHKDGTPRGVNLRTNEEFGSAVIELEVMVSKGSNSGIYILGEYEVQVLDSFGKPDDKLGQGDFGAIYSASAPKLNASKEPGTWQTVLIDYDAPQYDAHGTKTAPLKVNKVVINGKTVQENVVVNAPTNGGVTGGQKIEKATGPLMFQGDHGAVAYRKIRISPK